MKRILLALVVTSLTASSALAGGWLVDIPRLTFPDQGAEVTQSCNALTQTCPK